MLGHLSKLPDRDLAPPKRHVWFGPYPMSSGCLSPKEGAAQRCVEAASSMRRRPPSIRRNRRRQNTQYDTPTRCRASGAYAVPPSSIDRFYGASGLMTTVTLALPERNRLFNSFS